MQVFKLKNMTKGWFVGDFVPSAFCSEDAEVAVKCYKKGDFEERHFHKIATELTAIIKGRVRMNESEFSEGDIVLVKPCESVDFRALQDTITAVVKLPSVKNDKFLGFYKDEKAVNLGENLRQNRVNLSQNLGENSSVNLKRNLSENSAKNSQEFSKISAENSSINLKQNRVNLSENSAKFTQEIHSQIPCKINILVPMAGAGSRFKEAGFIKPKPFIDVLGKPMIERVLRNLSFENSSKNLSQNPRNLNSNSQLNLNENSNQNSQPNLNKNSQLNLHENSSLNSSQNSQLNLKSNPSPNTQIFEPNFILIAQKAHLKAEFKLVNRLKAEFKAKFISLDKLTLGTACSLLSAIEFIDNDTPLLIANSDQIVDLNVGCFVRDCFYRHLDGSILVFRDETRDKKWSFVALNERNLVSWVREKEAISEFASVGLYFFTRGRDFVRAAVEMIVANERVNDEFYTAPCYNYAIKNGAKIGIYEISKAQMHGLGTPQDLAEYEKIIKREEN